MATTINTFNMKTLLITFTLVFLGYLTQAQVVCLGISPANITGSYDFTWADPQGGDWSTPDFLISGTYVQDTLMLADDGTSGLNAQGNPISAEACNPLINSLTGKIAVIYRNTCNFSTKALNAQNAGAVGVIIINREAGVIGMAGGADGPSITIPVVMISLADGMTLVDEMTNGPVVMFLGNKIGAHANDIGTYSNEMLISSYGGADTSIFDGFNPGIQLYNYGSNTQSSIVVTANIDGPAGNVYNQSINAPTMFSGDTLSIFNGNTYAFPPFYLGGIGNYPLGDYVLTYTLSLGTTDDDPTDNTITSNFTVNDQVVALSRIDTMGHPIANNYPGNSTVEYQTCMFFEDPNASNIGIQGVHFVPYTDTLFNSFIGSEIFINAYEWNDTWVDLLDPNYATNNSWFQNLNNIRSESHIPASNSESGTSVYVPFTTPLDLVNNQRYLFCLQTFDTQIAFGYDAQLKYETNSSINSMPICPIYIDDTWFMAGWTNLSALSMSLVLSGTNPCGHTATIDQSGATPITICSGDSILLTCNTDPGFVYQWSLNGAAIINEINASVYATEAGNYTVNIDSDNCQIVSSEVEILLTTPSIPTITSIGTITLCSDDSVTLEAPAGFSSYDWSTGETGQTIAVTSSGTFWVEVTDALGCSATSASFTVNVSLMQEPQVCIVGVDTAFNFNRIVWEKPITTGIDSFFVYRETAVANNYVKIGAKNYLDVAVFIDQASNPMVQANRYKLSILDTCGIESPLGNFHKTIHLTINQGIDQSWNLIWSHYEGITFGTYTIYRGSTLDNMTLLTTISSNLNSYTDLAAPIGQLYYLIEVENLNGCNPLKSNYGSSLSNLVENGELPNALTELGSGSVNVYPNPTTDVIYLVTEGVELPYTVELYDIGGRMILNKTCNLEEEVIDISTCERGVYLVKISTSNSSKEIRVFKN
ncbi:MAG: T9SS type A sorting domain-containing protein [Crocinitomicaceae bacterium]|nr:T9SS type A sorting domain-containing protein [Crocinitomicaceae bacterium]